MDYIDALSNLRTNQKWGRKSPHKAVLMLAVIELYETNVFTENIIYYNDVLKNTFKKVWKKVLPDEQLFQDEAYLPFWYLQSDSFWHVVPKRGREDILCMMVDNHIQPSEAKIVDCVNYVELDEDLYFLMTLPSGRSSLKRTLLENYTSLSKQAIERFSQSVDNSVDHSISALSEYEKILSQKRTEERDKPIEVETNDSLISQFSKLNEDIQITLNLQYYSFLKSHRGERAIFKGICPSVHTLLDHIVNNPVKRTDVSPTLAVIYENFLSDLKIALLSEEDSMELIDKIGEAIRALRGDTKDGNASSFNDEKSFASSKRELFKDNPKQVEDTIILTKELIESARTPNGGFTKSQLAAIGVPWPRPTDWIEQVVGKEITQQQLEDFRRIEYITKPSKPVNKIEPDHKEQSYKDIAKDDKERKRMKAIMRVFRKYQHPLSPRELAFEISWDDWGSFVVRPNDIETLLHMMPEIEQVGQGKYSLKIYYGHEETPLTSSISPNQGEELKAEPIKNRRWSLSEVRELVNFYKAGMSTAQLADFFNRDVKAVNEILYQKGLLSK